MPWRKWRQGDRIAINRIVWGEQEKLQIDHVLDADWFGPGSRARLLEQRLADFNGTKYCLLTNSGSSAIELICRSLLHLHLLKPDSMILHPACTFPTSIAPFIRAGMPVVLTDITEGTYVVSPGDVAQALWEYPVIDALMLPHLMGNVPDMRGLSHALGDRLLIEDCCDTLGSSFDGRPVGSFGIASAFSFYGSHHISTFGVGGCLCTNNEELYRTARSLAFWGRRFLDEYTPFEDFQNRYTYETIGFDMQMTEVQAAFGLAQLERLERLNAGRIQTFDMMLEFFEADIFKEGTSEGAFVLPRSSSFDASPIWFSFPLLVREDAGFSRDDLARHLLDRKIEIRPIFAGNLARQPAYAGRPELLVSGDLFQSDRAMNNGLFIPCWGAMTGEQVDHIFNAFLDFFTRKRELGS